MALEVLSITFGGHTATEIGVEVVTNQGTFGAWLQERDLRQNGGVMADCWRNRSNPGKGMFARARRADSSFGKALMHAIEGNPLTIRALAAYDATKAADAWAQQQKNDQAVVTWARKGQADAMYALLQKITQLRGYDLDVALSDARHLVAAIDAKARG